MSSDNDNEKPAEASVSASTPAPTPAPVLSGEPEEALEKKLSKHPDDLDAKVDVGSDESMDASDPSAASQPGQTDDPVPSSGFPE